MHVHLLYKAKEEEEEEDANVSNEIIPVFIQSDGQSQY